MFPLCGVRGFTNYRNGHLFDHEFARFRKDNVLVGRIPINGNMVYWFIAQPYVPTGLFINIYLYISCNLVFFLYKASSITNYDIHDE